MKDRSEFIELVNKRLVGRELLVRDNVLEVIASIEKDLINSGNHYIANNHPTTEQIVEIEEIIRDTLISFKSKLGITDEE